MKHGIDSSNPRQNDPKMVVVAPLSDQVRAQPCVHDCAKWCANASLLYQAAACNRLRHTDTPLFKDES